MKDDSILEPLKMFNGKFKQIQHENGEKYFEELVKESKIDVNANRETIKKYKNEFEQGQYYEKKEGSVRGIKILLVIVGIAALISGLTMAFSGVKSSSALFIVLGIAIFALGIFSFVAVFTKINKIIEERKRKKEEFYKKASDLKVIAYNQMAPLNSLYDYYMTSEIIEHTSSLIQLDDIFDADKYEYLHEKFNLGEVTDPNTSVNYVVSGSIVGNPFVIVNTFNMQMVQKVYTGSIVIHWTTIERSKNGTRTVHHSQTLTASVTKPAPDYYYDTRLIYGCDAAPNLSFGHEPTNINGMNERQLEKYVKRETKKLEEKEEKATKNGENFTVMANNEFDALFNGDDRDNEVEFRLLFTPLAQKNMLDLLKSKVPYGDDFYFYKHKKLNYIISSHSQNFDYNPDMSIFHHFDVDEAKKNFVEFNDKYYQSLYFDLAPLLAIPSYQQIKTQEYIYNTPYRANLTSYEHESLANRFDKDLLKHPESSTNLIIKTKFETKNGKSDQVTIEAHSFKAVKQTTVVSKLGGDGRMHAVPVVWYEYIPIVKNTLMEAKNTKLRKNEYLKEKNNSEFSQFMSQYSKNNAIIYERGLFSVLLDKELDENSSLKFNSLLARKGEKE